MKKKVVAVVVGFLFVNIIGFVVPTLSSQDTRDSFEDCGCGEEFPNAGLSENQHVVMSNPIDCTQLQITPVARTARSLPDAFSWKDVDGSDWTTLAKNQGNCGSCWDFAAMGALESRIKIMEDCAKLQPDLSEQYVLSCLPAAANNYGQGCLGGTPYGAYLCILDDGEEGNYANGIIPESCFPYRASHTVSCDSKCADWEEQLIPLTGCNLTFLDLGYATEENTDILKTILYEEGPIAVALNVTQEFINYWSIHHSPDDYFPDTHEPWGNRLNHIVVLVGWKDDPAIENGGYWIVKNSWGIDWGYDGFFNLEYYGLFFGMYYSWASYDPEGFDWAPVADAGGLYSADPGEVIAFDGAGSVDPEGAIVSYVWDFGDNTTGEGLHPTHSYIAEGIYGLSLTVTDLEGKTGTANGLVGVGIDPVTIDVKGILGLNITIENSMDIELTNLEWTVQMTGHVLLPICHGIIPQLPNQETYSRHLSLLGFGFGELTINVENIQKTEKFLVLGPFVFGLQLQ